jgi:predicted DNA binding CopG/RHH family protein
MNITFNFTVSDTTMEFSSEQDLRENQCTTNAIIERARHTFSTFPSVREVVVHLGTEYDNTPLLARLRNETRAEGLTFQTYRRNSAIRIQRTLERVFH